MDLIVLLTGSSDGIGLQLAKKLYGLGATLILPVRDLSKSNRIYSEIGTIKGDSKIIIEKMNLNSLEEIKNFVKKTEQKVNRIDVVVNNAGLIALSRKLSVDNIELTFQVNYLSHFYLSLLCMPLLIKSDKKPLILNITSRSHKRAGFYKNDLELEDNYGFQKAYNQSKLAQVMFTHTLAKKCDKLGISVNCAHPGLVKTRIGNKSTTVIHSLIWNVMKLLGRSSAAAAQSLVPLIMDMDYRKRSGKFFGNLKELETSKKSKDQNFQDYLWNESIKLTGINVNQYIK